MSNGYIDSDGHVMENERELNEFLGAPFKGRGYKSFRQMVPTLDGFHTPKVELSKEGAFDPSVTPSKWLEFLKRTGIDYTVLFPTRGLAHGRMVIPEWAAAYATTYNNWLYEKYLRVSSSFKGVALIPMQDVDAAVRELRRAVKELGMVAAMIPSNGLIKHVSAKEYWPVYREAEELDCALTFHGGSYEHLGFNTFTVFPATRALGMPFPLAIAMTGLMVDGVLDAFPRLRVGFLEGGSCWIPMVLDRLDRELEYGGLSSRLKQRPEEYFKNGRVFVGCEGNEKTLAYAIQRIGHRGFMFASDFPHEITMENCMEEIDEICNRTDIDEDCKTAILKTNARNFYRI
jgi:uncharacterized protein